MAIDASAQVHPTAILTGDIELGANTVVGPYAILEGPIRLGPDCVISPHAHLYGELVMGRGNKVGPGSVIGSDPQHLGYAGQPTRTIVGDHNQFREFVTIHRGSHAEGETILGDHNYFMANSHIGHDSHVGNRCVFANASLIAGHCRIGDGVFCSGLGASHQFVRIGRLAMISGMGLALRDLLPFMICYGRSHVAGVNVVGMRRAGIPRADIDAVRKAYHILYRSDSIIKVALEQVARELGTNPAVAEIVEFAKHTKRGIVGRSKHDLDD